MWWGCVDGRVKQFCALLDGGVWACEGVILGLRESG